METMMEPALTLGLLHRAGYGIELLSAIARGSSPTVRGAQEWIMETMMNPALGLLHRVG